MSSTTSDGALDCRMSLRFSKSEKDIVDKVRAKFKLSSDAEAVRFVMNLWWKTLGSEAVDTKKLAEILVKECGDEDAE